MTLMNYKLFWILGMVASWTNKLRPIVTLLTTGTKGKISNYIWPKRSGKAVIPNDDTPISFLEYRSPFSYHDMHDVTADACVGHLKVGDFSNFNSSFGYRNIVVHNVQEVMYSAHECLVQEQAQNFEDVYDGVAELVRIPDYVM